MMRSPFPSLSNASISSRRSAWRGTSRSEHCAPCWRRAPGFSTWINAALLARPRWTSRAARGRAQRQARAAGHGSALGVAQQREGVTSSLVLPVVVMRSGEEIAECRGNRAASCARARQAGPRDATEQQPGPDRGVDGAFHPAETAIGEPRVDRKAPARRAPRAWCMMLGPALLALGEDHEIRRHLAPGAAARKATHRAESNRSPSVQQA